MSGVDRLIDAYNAFLDLYEGMGLISFSQSRGILVLAKWFLETFQEYDVVEDDSDEYPVTLKTVHSGVLFYCFVPAKLFEERFEGKVENAVCGGRKTELGAAV